MSGPDLLQEIIQTSPLYKKTTFVGMFKRTWLGDVPPQNFYCDGTCQSTQTFALSSIDNDDHIKYRQGAQPGIGLRDLKDGTYTLMHTCLKCGTYQISHSLKFVKELIKAGEDSAWVTYITKIGQYPSFEQTLDDDLKKWLSKEDAELYQKGVRCESYSYGIGAFGYFRRILENNIEKILDDLAATTDSEELKEAIKEAKLKHIASDRLEIITKHTPASFKPKGQNIFTILYKALSAGLHEQTDENCLKKAASIRTCLNFLVKKVSQEKENTADLTASLTALTQNEEPQPTT